MIHHDFNSWQTPGRNSCTIGLRLGSAATDKLKLNYGYGSTEKNGNVLSQTITVPTVAQNPGFTAVQNYQYDSLNRLKSAEEIISSQTSWKQTFTFDRYGNRRFDVPNTTTLAPGCAEAVCNPTIDPATNKLIGYQFDDAGNTKTDANGQTFVYDSENKQVQVINASGTVGQYFYNGDGQRVKKVVPSTGETTVFVYDASNKLVAEYSTIVEPASTEKTSYFTNDHLGSPRINTDAGGAVIARHDYLPFGEEIQSGTGERNSVQGYSGQDSIRQKFTGYERDAETDLDFAQARMYGFSHGRFMSVDPYNPFLGFFGYDFDNSNLRISQFISQPQYWNRYIYSVNNPLKFVDRDGEHPVAAIIVAVVIRAAVGATAGAAAGAAIEAGKQIYRDGKITDLNAIKSASLDGAIFGAFIGGAGPIGAAIGAPIRTAIVAGGVGSVTGGSVRRSMEGQETTTGDVITDAVAGGVGGGAGAVLGRLTAPKYKYPNGLNSNLQRRVSDETVYRTVNQTANKLFVPRSITNSLFDSQMGLRTKTYGSSFPATVARGITKSSIRSTNKPKKCPQGPNQCTEVTVTVLDDE